MSVDDILISGCADDVAVAQPRRKRLRSKLLLRPPVAKGLGHTAEMLERVPQDSPKVSVQPNVDGSRQQLPDSVIGCEEWECRFSRRGLTVCQVDSLAQVSDPSLPLVFWSMEAPCHQDTLHVIVPASRLVRMKRILPEIVQGFADGGMKQLFTPEDIAQLLVGPL